MPLIQARCSNCDGEIEIDSDKMAGKCKHCGTLYITEEVINNYNTVNQYHTTQHITKNIYGNDSLDAEDYIKNGEVFISLEDYLKAEIAFNNAINQNPADWRGWFGIVKTKTSNFTDYDDISHLEYLKKAKKVANKKQQLEIELLYKDYQRIKKIKDSGHSEKYINYKEKNGEKLQKYQQKQQLKYLEEKKRMNAEIIENYNKSIINTHRKKSTIIITTLLTLIAVLILILWSVLQNN